VQANPGDGLDKNSNWVSAKFERLRERRRADERCRPEAEAITVTGLAPVFRGIVAGVCFSAKGDVGY